MKITEEKHNHKLTNLLKVFIFSVLMCVPLLSVAVRCGYIMFNKNAYLNYSGSNQTEIIYKYQSNEVNNSNDLIVNNIYKLNDFDENNYSGQSYIEFSFKILNDEIYFNGLENEYDYIDDNYIYSNLEYTMYIDTYNNCTVTFTNLNFIQYSFSAFNSSYDNIIIQLTFEPDIYDPNNELVKNLFEYTDYNEIARVDIVENTLDNVFEYSINKLEEEQYLTWTKNTAVYTGINAMTTGLGITNTVIPMLIVYWFILTIIYIIIDIILTLFTKLTHMIGNKTT